MGLTQWRSQAAAITEFDISIDSGDPQMAGANCLLRVVLHELGHGFGLDHQNDLRSLMYPTLDCARPILPSRDAQAAWALYG